MAGRLGPGKGQQGIYVVLEVTSQGGATAACYLGTLCQKEALGSPCRLSAPWYLEKETGRNNF